MPFVQTSCSVSKADSQHRLQVSEGWWCTQGPLPRLCTCPWPPRRAGSAKSLKDECVPAFPPYFLRLLQDPSKKGWACEVPERWVCSCFSIFARKGNFPDFSRTPAVFDKACRQQVFLLVSWQHSSPGWADHRALINNCFYQGFQDLALEVEFLDFWSLSELQPWKGLLPEVSFLAKSKTSCESSKPYIYIWELLVVVIPYW